MSLRNTLGLVAMAALLVGSGLSTHPALAESIDVGSYPATGNSWPYLIAKEAGFFQKVGSDVTDVISTGGGGADMRNLIGGNLIFAQASLGSIVAAVQSGLDVKIVSDDFDNSVAISFVVMPNSPIKNPKTDFKGKKIAYSNPQSVTQAYELWMVNKLGYGPNDVQGVPAGGFPQALTLLEHGNVDVSVITEPVATINQKKYRTVVYGYDSSIFPTANGATGVVSAKTAAERPDDVRKVILARAMAVDFMTNHRPEAAAIIAKANKIDPSVVMQVLAKFIDKGTNDGVPVYPAHGEIHMKSMENELTMAKMVGSIKGDVDLKSMIDTSYLPAGYQTLK